ncbi:Parathyroid hormone/parathyroid hormone-related peptide receptor [Mactra antiquata]
MDCETIFNSSKDVSKLESGIVYLTFQEQQFLLQFKKQECLCRMKEEPQVLEGVYCNRTWDNILCWGDTKAGETVSKPCPGYINTFRKHGFATRTCLSDGTWFKLDNTSDTSRGWTNYNACMSSHDDVVTADPTGVPFIISENVKDLRLMYNIGYTLSLISLFVAFIIMIYYKKLHCSRNTIHLNLFGSFMLRAFISLIRDNFMVAGLGFPADVILNDTSGTVLFKKEGVHWECRLFFSIFQYVLVASYIWIFVEAIYLHMYIFVSVFTEKVKVWWFCLLGWVFPAIVVLCWCMARYNLDNTLCWNTHHKLPGLVWILQGPVMLTIVLNLVFFVNMVRVLYTKLQAPQCPNSKKTRLRRLARSTLFLVPAFGVYFIFFTIPFHNLSDTMAFVMLFIEMFFNSFQGFFIALVLCFISHEVRVEIRKSWSRSNLPSCLPCTNENRGNSFRSRSSLGHSNIEVSDKLLKKNGNSKRKQSHEMKETKLMNGQADLLIHDKP